MKATSLFAGDTVVFDLKISEASDLAKLGRRPLPNPYEDFESFLAVARSISDAMPARVRTRLVEFAKYGSKDGALMLRGFPLDDHLPPTPIQVGAQVRAGARRSELWMCSIAVLLGEPFAYRYERNGSIFHEVFPSVEHANKLSSQSSSAPLDFHTEMVFHPFSPDYLLLYGLRQDPQKLARTFFSGIRRINPLLTATTRQSLFAESFAFNFAHIHSPYVVDDDLVSACKTLGPTVSVLYGDASDPYLRFEPELMLPQAREADAALKVLQALVLKCRREVIIEPGCLLVLDNRRCVHARSVFRADFNGRDRWLRRMHVTRNLEKSRADRSAGSRVIDMDLRAGWGAACERVNRADEWQQESTLRERE